MALCIGFSKHILYRSFKAHFKFEKPIKLFLNLKNKEHRIGVMLASFTILIEHTHLSNAKLINMFRGKRGFVTETLPIELEGCLFFFCLGEKLKAVVWLFPVKASSLRSTCSALRSL